MTVAAKSSTIIYAEDGVSVLFAVPFRFKDKRDLVVDRIVDGVAARLVLDVDYTVAGGDTDAGGTLTRLAATSGGTLRIQRFTARTQPMVYTTGDRFPAKSHEAALDRQMLIAQEADEQIADLYERAILVPFGFTGPAFTPHSRGILGIFDGAVSLQPLLGIIPAISNLYDDGAWGGAFTTDGAWG